MNKALSVVLLSMAVLQAAVAAEVERVEPVMQLAALELQCLDGLRMGQASAAPHAAMQPQAARVQEYLEFHAQAAEHGRVLLPWSVISAIEEPSH